MPRLSTNCLVLSVVRILLSLSLVTFPDSSQLWSPQDPARPRTTFTPGRTPSSLRRFRITGSDPFPINLLLHLTPPGRGCLGLRMSSGETLPGAACLAFTWRHSSRCALIFTSSLFSPHLLLVGSRPLSWKRSLSISVTIRPLSPSIFPLWFLISMSNIQSHFQFTFDASDSTSGCGHSTPTSS